MSETKYLIEKVKNKSRWKAKVRKKPKGLVRTPQGLRKKGDDTYPPVYYFHPSVDWRRKS